MPSDNIRHIEADGTVREQWLIGASSIDEIEDGSFSRPTYDDIMEAMQNIDSEFICFAMNAETGRYDFEMAWQSSVRFTDSVRDDIADDYASVSSGEIDEQSLLQELVAAYMADDTHDVIGIAISVGNPKGSYG